MQLISRLKMSQKVSITKQCRLCSKSEDNLINLYTDDFPSRNLMKIICDRLDIKVSESDALPKVICWTCKRTVEEFEAFRQSCLLAEKSFETSLQDTSSLSCRSQGSRVTGVLENQEIISFNNCVESFPLRSQNIKVEADESDSELSKSYLEMSYYGNANVETAKLKDPLQDDYILVKEETFTLNDWDKRLPNAFVEFSRPTVTPSDRVLVENVKKREVLPQMWDVYEKQVNHNIMNVVMRRYIISKAAFPCSLCNKCISLKYENMPGEDESLPKSYGTETEDSATMLFETLGNDSGTLSISTEGGMTLTYGYETNGSEPVSYGAGEDNSEVLLCEFCQKPFPRLNSLKRHLRTHFGYKSLPCKVCGKGFSRKEHLVRHMLLHTGGRPFECEVCKKTFTRKEHLTRHQLTHDESELGRLHSTHPDYYSSNFDSGGRGVLGEGSSVKPRAHVCGICGSRFGRKEHLMRHLRRTHDLNFPSSTTLSHFTSATSITTNSTTTRLGEDTAPISVIANETLTKASLPVSTSGLVSEERTFLCNLCPRSFSREEHLARHLKIHVRDSMFVNESRVPGTDITMSLINTND